MVPSLLRVVGSIDPPSKPRARKQQFKLARKAKKRQLNLFWSDSRRNPFTLIRRPMSQLMTGCANHHAISASAMIPQMHLVAQELAGHKILYFITNSHRVVFDGLMPPFKVLR